MQKFEKNEKYFFLLFMLTSLRMIIENVWKKLNIHVYKKNSRSFLLYPWFRKNDMKWKKITIYCSIWIVNVHFLILWQQILIIVKLNWFLKFLCCKWIKERTCQNIVCASIKRKLLKNIKSSTFPYVINSFFFTGNDFFLLKILIKCL